MNVLSLFDGMSCGQIALKQLGIIPDIYYASEIDKHAISQTQLNFPDTIQLGSVTDVDVSKLEPIDLLIGGSPCQSFSFAGKRIGMKTVTNEEIYTLDRYIELKSEGFRFEGQSYLFWEYMRILTDIRKYNPDVLFLLENVEMGKKWERTLSEAIGIYGVHINSSLVSAQNRRRIYWTNIRTKQIGLFGEVYTDIPQPEDKGIFLRDILESEVHEKYYLSDRAILGIKNRKERQIEKGNGFGARFPSTKSNTLLDRCYKDGKDNLICVAMRGRETCLTPKKTEYGKAIRKDYEAGRIEEKRRNIQRLEPRSDGKTNCLTSIQKDNLICQMHRGKKSRPERIYNIEGNSPTIGNNHFSYETRICDKNIIRRLTPAECARLQTIPEWYKWRCSDTQQYKMLGNGWTVDVIVHILSFMNFPIKSKKDYNE